MHQIRQSNWAPEVALHGRVLFSVMTELLPVDCIVKLGGSALTIKSQFETLNFASIDA